MYEQSSRNIFFCGPLRVWTYVPVIQKTRKKLPPHQRCCDGPGIGLTCDGIPDPPHVSGVVEVPQLNEHLLAEPVASVQNVETPNSIGIVAILYNGRELPQPVVGTEGAAQSLGELGARPALDYTNPFDLPVSPDHVEMDGNPSSVVFGIFPVKHIPIRQPLVEPPGSRPDDRSSTCVGFTPVVWKNLLSPG